MGFSTCGNTEPRKGQGPAASPSPLPSSSIRFFFYFRDLVRPAGTGVWKGWTNNAVKPAPNCQRVLDFPPWLLSILPWSRAPCGGGRCHSLGVGTAVLPGLSGWPVLSQASLHAGLFALEQPMPRSAAHRPQGVWSCCGTVLYLGESLLGFLWVCL